MTNVNKINKPIETVEQVARKIWLAGLGAYGKGFEEIQHQYDKLNDRTNRYFEELVVKGEKLESDTKKKLKKQTDVKKRVDEVRKKLNLEDNDIDSKINELSSKVDELTLTVSKLAS